MEFINDPNNPPAGHYSQAVIANGLVFLSGVLPAALAPGDFENQVRQVLAKANEILVHAGSALDHAVQCTAYIVGVEHWPDFNRVYMEVLGQHKPARTVVPVTELHYGSLVELQVVAALRQTR
ncbi:RidA family protein [Bordetella sp. BOR01]|uniref:RidA family protein n=1 Tax=Bordetella sp. BOR01 TaxID=2854779 RepID=UPI001C458C77|nr:RidA family protein [Bordetella sp. BOR01]MBV7484904.1 RidA family protein [Bordetella sp. BOR01]